MSKLQEAYNNLIGNIPNLVTLAPLINSKNKFSEEEKLKMFAVIQQHLDYACAIEEDLERRLGFTVVDSNEPLEGQGVVVAIAPKPVSVAQPLTYVITETGKAFKGDPNNTIAVPVTMEPVLYKSQAARWSWRTKVASDSDFRHINVSNFYAKAKDSSGQWYAVVDRTWKTDQPEFRDFCNKPQHVPDPDPSNGIDVDLDLDN